MISTFIDRARRRYLCNELLAQLALAAALTMGALVVLLLLGTQILDWRVAFALVAAGLSFGLYRVFRRMPSRYRLAVMVDERAELYDSLSTALHYAKLDLTGEAAQIRETQRRHAEKLLAAVDLERAVPFTLPRAIYAMAILALVASSLFALRYGFRRTLDLKPPLTQIVMDAFGFDSPQAREQAAMRKQAARKNTPVTDSLDEPGSSAAHPGDKKTGEMDAASQSALDQVNDPDTNNEGVQNASAKNSDGKMQAGDKNGDGEDAEASDSGTPGTQGKNDSSNPSGSQDGPQQGEQSAGQQNSSGSNSSLLSKVKEAMSNLLSKAKPQPNAGAGQKPSQQQGAQRAQSKNGGEKGAQQGQQNGQEQASDSQDGQQAGDSDNSENSQNKTGGKSADQQTSSQPGSGIGKQDGQKDVKAAEQLAAMGKLSEVIGKRSASVSGEMMIEQQSGPQQLRTQYTQSGAAHGEAAGEVNRDEVPVALQNYVQQYFDQVRKADQTAAKPVKKGQ